MIIYGSKSTQLAKEHITDKCPNCGTQNRVDMFVFQKYAHVFWIPFFPMSKIGISQCDHCKQILKEKEMPADLRASYAMIKAQTKTPIWTFAGVGIIALLIAFVVYQGKQKDDRNAKLILAPKAGDVFEIKTTDQHYTLYKVVDIGADSVFILINKFESDQSRGLADIKRKGDDAYIDDVYGFSKSDIKTKLEKGEIIDIIRK